MKNLAYKIQKVNEKRERRNYGKTKSKVELNNLLEIQKDSYNWFITEGIKEVFDDVFPVESFTGNLSLEFGEYSFDEPRHTIKTCKERYSTYAAPLKVEARLFNVETGEVKEQEIYLGDMPIMTESGAFIINGAERVIVSQLVRSPSVYFGKEVDKKNGKVTVGAQIIPTRGTWLEYETDARDIIYVRIDRTRKVPVTTLLRAIGLSSDSDILDLFGNDDYLIKTIEKDTNKNTDEALIDIHSKLRPGEPSTLESAKNQLITRFFDAFRYDLAKVGRYKFNKKLNITDRLLGCRLAEDIKVDGEIIAKNGDVVTKEWIAAYEEKSGKVLQPAQIERLMIDVGAYRETVLRMKIQETAKQNLLSYAPLEVLEHIGEPFGVTKLLANYSRTTLKFSVMRHWILILRLMQGAKLKPKTAYSYFKQLKRLH